MGTLLAESRDDSKILSEMHNMLHLLVKRVEGTEKELKQMKQKICLSNAVSKKKPQIPQIVRVSLVLQSLPSTLMIFMYV